jgi:hypothetical protein
MKSPDITTKWLLYTQIIGAVFLQKIAIPTGSDTPLFLGLFIMLGATAIGALSHRLAIDKTRFALYLLLAGGMALTQIIGGYEFSLLSLLLLLIIHLPYIFTLKRSTREPGVELRYFQTVMAILAVLGIVQFGLQFAIGWKLAFFMDTQLPAQLIMTGYNNLNTIKAGSGIYKSNGLFMLEPAMFCQFLAISIIIEAVYFKRLIWVALYCLGLITTFSGTGLVILSLLLPAYLLQKRKYKVIFTLLIMVLALIIAAPFIGLDSYVGRINEFSNHHTSGFARFLSVFLMIYDFILPQADTLLLGMGAGSSKEVQLHVDYLVHLPSWGKIWFEYGLIGMACYLPLMLNAMLRSKRSGYLKAALMIQFFFDGYVLIPTVHGIILALLAWPKEAEPANDFSKTLNA